MYVAVEYPLLLPSLHSEKQITQMCKAELGTSLHTFGFGVLYRNFPVRNGQPTHDRPRGQYVTHGYMNTILTQQKPTDHASHMQAPTTAHNQEPGIAC